MQRIDVAERRARLLRRHRLAPGDHASHPLEVARSLVALHSTDAASVFLAVRARSRGVTPGDIERAFYDERCLVRMLAMRRTLWAVPRELVPVVHAAATRTVAARERRRLEGIVRDSGLSTRPAAWLARAERAALEAVAEEGEAPTSDVVARVPLLAKKLRVGAGTKWEIAQSAGARVLSQLGMEGSLVRTRPRGTWAGQQYHWTSTEKWLGAGIEPVDTASAQAHLVRLWLASFGPATETDVRWWTGWTVREVRAAVAATPHVQVDLDGATGIVLAGDREPTAPPEPCAALLPTLDPTTMGWKVRDWYLGSHGATLFDRNGNAGPTVWWEGRVVGGWTQRRDGEIAVGLLEDVGREATDAIAAEARHVRDWFGDVRVSPTFLPPYQRGLAGEA